MSDALEAELDRLYRLPLSEFAGARNALAARLRASGDRGSAGRAKALGKPSATAWAVNQVHFGARAALDAFFDASAAVRSAQAQGASAAEVREAMRRRGQTLEAVLREADAALEKGGHATSPAARRRVAATLEALAHRGSADPARPGRLVEDLEPPGLEVLAGLASAPPRPRPEAAEAVASPSNDAESRAEAEAERARAENEVRRRRQAAEVRQSAAREAGERLAAARLELQEARRRLARAEERERETREAERAAREEAERTSAELTAAEELSRRLEARLPGSGR